MVLSSNLTLFEQVMGKSISESDWCELDFRENATQLSDGHDDT